jgi:hypothetical protein
LSRYFFQVVAASGVDDDDEGTELSSLEQARAEAIADARTLMSNAILLGNDISDRHINICDHNGDVLMRLDFSEAVRRKD